MSLILEEPLVIFDLETTGLDVNKDRIVEIAAVKVAGKNMCQLLDQLHLILNPEMPIAAEASAVHGITIEHVKYAPNFISRAQVIADFFADCAWCGYNSNHFDVPMLLNELQRSGYTVDTIPTLIDVCTIFRQEMPHTLAYALQYYCHRDHKNAHSALSDVMATASVLAAQVDRHCAADVTLHELHAKYAGNNVDFGGKIIWNEQHDDMIFNFGKHKGKLVRDNLDYLNWCAKEKIIHKINLKQIAEFLAKTDTDY